MGISTILLGTVDAALGQVVFNRHCHAVLSTMVSVSAATAAVFPLLLMKCLETAVGPKANLLYCWKRAEGIFPLIIHPIIFRRTCARYIVLHSFRQIIFPLLILSYFHYHILFSIVLKHESIRDYAVVPNLSILAPDHNLNTK